MRQFAYAVIRLVLASFVFRPWPRVTLKSCRLLLFGYSLALHNEVDWFFWTGPIVNL